MDPKQQRAASRTQTSFLFLIFLLPFISIMSAMVLILLSPSSYFINSISILHQVPKGHVAVYWRGGALQKTITEPGFHVKMPFITQYGLVQVTPQTDVVTDIPCGTKGGVKINFEKIQVVNRLHKKYAYETLLNYGVHYNKIWIHDKIHHHINQFCATHSLQQVYIDDFMKIGEKMKEALQVDCTRYAPGIEIIDVHATRPAIPDNIRRRFEELEEERIKELVAIERQKVVEQEAEISKKLTISEVEKNARLSKILMEQTLLENEGFRSQQEIENQMYLQRERCRGYADFYRATKEAEANKRLELALKFMETFVEIAKRSSGMTSFSPGHFNMSISRPDLFFTLRADLLRNNGGPWPPKKKNLFRKI